MAQEAFGVACPIAFFGDVANGTLSVNDAFAKYAIPDFAPNCNDNEKLYAFLLHSDLYYRFREAGKRKATNRNRNL